MVYFENFFEIIKIKNKTAHKEIESWQYTDHCIGVNGEVMGENIVPDLKKPHVLAFWDTNGEPGSMVCC